MSATTPSPLPPTSNTMFSRRRVCVADQVLDTGLVVLVPTKRSGIVTSGVFFLHPPLRAPKPSGFLAKVGCLGVFSMQGLLSLAATFLIPTVASFCGVGERRVACQEPYLVCGFGSGLARMGEKKRGGRCGSAFKPGTLERCACPPRARTRGFKRTLPDSKLASPTSINTTQCPVWRAVTAQSHV